MFENSTVNNPFHFLYDGKLIFSAIDGDKALSCMSFANVKSHQENRLVWNHCLHSDLTLNMPNTTIGSFGKIRIFPRKYSFS